MTSPTEFPTRWPLVIEPSNRSSSTSQDAHLVNCYTEAQPNGEGTYIIKRPGAVIYNSQSYGTAGTGSGIFNWNLDIYQVVGTHFIKNGAAIATVDGTAGHRYTFTSIQGAVPTLFFGNGVKSYYYNLNSGFVTAIPATFTPGLVSLDGTLYYVANNTLFGSGINDVTTWSVLNSLPVQVEPDYAIFCAKHLTYIVVFKQWTTEIFTDNGNPSGSPLISNPGSLMQIGCLSDNSVTDVDGDLFWIAGTRSGSCDVYRMTGLTPIKVSTPAVQKLIEKSSFTETTTFGLYYKGAGHTFYIITLGDINLTLAYDINENTWSQWTDPSGNYLPFSSSSFQGTSTLLQHATNGNVYTMGLATTQDYNGLIPVHIYTPEFDGQVDRRKILNMLRFNTDRTEGSVLQVRNNDNKYQSDKWTNFRTVQLRNTRPFLDNCGTFYSRAYHFKHVSNTPLRIYSVDMDIDLGTL